MNHKIDQKIETWKWKKKEREKKRALFALLYTQL